MIDLNYSLSIWQFVWSLFFIQSISSFKCCLVVKGDLTHLLFDFSNVFKVIMVNVNTGSDESVQKLFSHINPSEVHTLDGMRKSITFKDRHCMCHSLSTLNHDSSCLSCREKRKNCRIHNAQLLHSYFLEQDWGCFAFIFFWCERVVRYE